MCATISAGSTSSAITTNFASPLSMNLVTSLVPFATLPVACAVSNASSACIVDAGDAEELVNEVVEKIAELKN